MVVSTAGKGKIRLRCEDCGEERVVQRNTAILEKKEHPCRSCSNKRNGLKKRGKPSWNSGKRMPEHERKIGSTYVNTHGYVEMYVGPEKSLKYGRKNGYVLVHKKVMQDAIGRPLKREEVIHHIDGDKLNNNINNLYLCPSLSHHRDIHNNLEQVAFHLVKMGVIIFDKETATYRIAPSFSNERVEPREFRERLRPNKQ